MSPLTDHVTPADPNRAMHVDACLEISQSATSRLICNTLPTRIDDIASNGLSAIQKLN